MISKLPSIIRGYCIQKKDGDASLTATCSAGVFSYTGSTKGTYGFENDKENVKFDYEDDDADQTYEILRLIRNGLWLREIGGDL
jgi:hypothetical protein